MAIASDQQKFIPQEYSRCSGNDALSSSRCDAYLGIILCEPGHNTRLQAVNGKCVRCDYRMAWIVIRALTRTPGLSGY
jgi:hypothetical protein